ncbi:MAG: addiction module protein [Ignavibacteriae bacterium]|nr:addiction module protein [Ignavibacteriota bacterium]
MNTPLYTEIMQLSMNERLQLVEDLWDSIQAQPDELPLSDEHQAIVEQRLQDLEKSPSQTISWEELKVHASRSLK